MNTNDFSSSLDKSAKKLGISSGELRRMEAKAIDEIDRDKSWDKFLKDLNKSAKAAAGIKDDPNQFVTKKRKLPMMPYGVTKLQNYRFIDNLIVFFDGHGLYLAKDRKHVILEYEIAAYWHACTISNRGNYIAACTANSPESGLAELYFFQPSMQKEPYWHKQMPTGWKDLVEIRVIEQNQRICLCYAQDIVELDYQGNIIDEKQVTAYRLKYSDAYSLEAFAGELIGDSMDGLSADDENSILYILSEIEGCLYPNRLSNTYKALGKCYEKNNQKEKALATYRKGLAMNPNLAVKKAIKDLESSLSEQPANMEEENAKEKEFEIIAQILMLRDLMFNAETSDQAKDLRARIKKLEEEFASIAT